MPVYVNLQEAMKCYYVQVYNWYEFWLCKQESIWNHVWNKRRCSFIRSVFFNQKRSGDIILNLEPGWIEKDGNITNHNSAYTYDTHVPLIWFGWRINRSSISRPVDLIDIAPTITNLLNISAPNGCSGKPILELIE